MRLVRREIDLCPKYLLLTVRRRYVCCGSLFLVFGVGFGDVSPCLCIDCLSSVKVVSGHLGGKSCPLG